MSYDLRISESHATLDWQVHPECQHEKLYDFCSMPCGCLAVSKNRTNFLAKADMSRNQTAKINQLYGFAIFSQFMRQFYKSELFFQNSNHTTASRQQQQWCEIGLTVLLNCRHFIDTATVCKCIFSGNSFLVLTQPTFGEISSVEGVLEYSSSSSLKSVSAYNPVEINKSLFTVYNFISWRLCIE